MNIRTCLSLTGLCTRGTYAWRLSLNLLLTLILSVFVISPSFADKDLNDVWYTVHGTRYTDNKVPISSSDRHRYLNNLNENANVVFSTPTSSTNSSFFAQNFIMPKDGKAITQTITDCTAKNNFTDDGILYEDFAGKPRKDTLTICPDNQWKTIKVEFTKFDLANGDSLFVYDGDLATVRASNGVKLGGGSGVGVSKAFGGWAVSSCTPAINPTGCLTFVFQTNGDFNKGIGWEAWVTCADRNMVLTPPAITNHILGCSETSKIQTIGAATVTAACGTISDDSTIVRITNTAGIICIDTCLSKNQNMVISKQFALGTYVVTYKLKGDTTKTAVTYFTISAPALVCNDHLIIPLGSACAVSLLPDMILESPCDTITGTMYYQIVVKTSSGVIIAQGTGIAGDYPVLNKDKIAHCSNENYIIEITRVYYDGLNLPFCNNGRQESKCSATVDFKDNSSPLFIEAASTDTIYACNPIISEEGLKVTRPKAIDNCSDVTVTFKKATLISSGNSCDAVTTYLVTWSASDECGNFITLNDTVKVLRPGVDKIVKVPNAVLSCGEDFGNVAEDLNKTGIPGIQVGLKKNGIFTPTDTIQLSTTEYVCNYILTKKDQRFPSTCGEKFFRYWTLVDWCDSNTGPMPIATQLIEFKDTLAPVLHCAAFTTLQNAEKIGLPPFQCSKKVSLPLPTATDICDLFPVVKMYTVERRENGAWWKVANNLGQAGALTADTFRVGFRAFDLCPEQLKEDSCFRYFILEDVTKPSAVCEDVLNISMSNDFARIFAKDIDAGSWDACGIEKLLIRREVCGLSGVWEGTTNTYVKSRLKNKLDPTGWADYADFSCCDLHHTVKIELLVIDKNGNYNFCWMEVIPEDKINPLCSDLPNQWDYCDNFHNGELGTSSDTNKDKQFGNTEWLKLEGDLADIYNQKYGKPFSVCVDNLTCQDLTIEQEYQLLDLECGVFKIKRRYRVKDWSGNPSNWAEQYITIEYRPNWKVTLPVDWTGTCGDGVPEEELIIENGACDLMSYESYDQQFDIVNDACFKVIRTYHIINWCKYKAGDQPVNINRIANNKGEVMNSQTISSGQYGNIPYLIYIQILKVNDTDAPTISVAEVENCMNNVNGCSDTKTFSATATDCNEASNESLGFQWEVFENNNSVGSGYGKDFNWVVKTNTNYKVKWRVADKCGNSAWAEKNYTFKDCKKPTPYCLDGLALELGSNKNVAIWASDFNLNSFDNCSPTDKLDLRMWHHSLDVVPPVNLTEVQDLPTGVTFGCLSIGTQEIHVYVIDEAGNYDFCITNVKVQDNGNVCPVTGGKIAGKIYTEYGEAVQDAEVFVMNNDSMMTLSDGNFEFDLTGSSAYTIIPKKDINILNGISTFDLVKITKHILGKELFTSPYQYIAADVNASGDVTTFDIIQLRKLILNLTDKFPNDNPSWRFVPANFEFKTGTPLEENFPEQILINSLNNEVPNLDFIAIKIGDINGNAATNNLLAADDRNTQGDFIIETEDRLVTAGETIEVVFHTDDFTAIEGYQFTLQYRSLELIAFDEGVAKASNFGFSLQNRGFLTTSWNNLTSAKGTDSPNLFRLTFKAKTSGSLSSLLEINSKFTYAEAYNNNGSLLGVALHFKRSAALFSEFSLHQNTPNPFIISTLIGFELPESAAVKLNIMDMQGRLVHTQEGEFGQGQQQMTVNGNNLESGTYFYQVLTPFGMATKKMIIID